MLANGIKCLLIDCLLKKYPNSIIGVEIPFLSGRRWVDVLVIRDDKKMLAFEIKSEKDNLQNLKQQIRDYSDTFNEVNIVLAQKFKNYNVLNDVSKNVGYAFVDSEKKEIVFKRKAITKTRLSKSNLAHFLWKKDLLPYVRNKDDSVAKIRDSFIKNNSLRYIKEKAVKVLSERYSKRFKTFIKERSEYTHIEDLNYLTKSYEDIL